MSIRIGDDAPDFSAETTEGTLRFHDWIGDGWAILFSHPKDFTPVCGDSDLAVAKLYDMIATPVNWRPGDDVIIPATVSDDDAKKKYPQGFKTHEPYLRTVEQPK